MFVVKGYLCSRIIVLKNTTFTFFCFNASKVKLHPKDELHQLDELKQNQRAHLEDLLEQHWSSRGDTFTQPGEGYSLAEEDASRSGEAVFFAPHWAHNSTRLLGAEEQTGKQEDAERKGEKVSEDNKTFSTGDTVGLEARRELEDNVDGLKKTKGKDNTENTHIQTHNQQRKDPILKSHTSGLYQQVTESPREDVLIERLGSRFQPTKEPNPEPRRRENETPEVERILQMEEEKLEAERKELLLLHKRLDQEKEVLRQQQNRREEEPGDGQHHSVKTVTQKPGRDCVGGHTHISIHWLFSLIVTIRIWSNKLFSVYCYKLFHDTFSNRLTANNMTV